MAREYPTYIYTNETEAKSKGEFIVRLVAPRFVAKIIHVSPGKPELRILEWIDDTTVQARFEFHSIKEHALNWYKARYIKPDQPMKIYIKTSDGLSEY